MAEKLIIVDNIHFLFNTMKIPQEVGRRGLTPFLKNSDFFLPIPNRFKHFAVKNKQNHTQDSISFFGRIQEIIICFRDLLTMVSVKSTMKISSILWPS